MINTLKGTIINERICQNNTFKYQIKDINDNEKAFTLFKNQISISYL